VTSSSNRALDRSGKVAMLILLVPYCPCTAELRASPSILSNRAMRLVEEAQAQADRVDIG
jgi:hypothetical protein